MAWHRLAWMHCRLRGRLWPFCRSGRPGTAPSFLSIADGTRAGCSLGVALLATAETQAAFVLGSILVRFSYAAGWPAEMKVLCLRGAWASGLYSHSACLQTATHLQAYTCIIQRTQTLMTGLLEIN